MGTMRLGLLKDVTANGSPAGLPLAASKPIAHTLMTLRARKQSRSAVRRGTTEAFRPSACHQ